MTLKTTVSKDQRPHAIEQLLRDYRRKNPGSWMRWNDALKAVGGSEREFSRMMRDAKSKILAEEEIASAIPELPADMQEAFERFSFGIWKKACDLADVSASELRRARQSDRDAMDLERAEHDEMVSKLADERDSLSDALASAKQESAELRSSLTETKAELRETQAALSEMRKLFATFTAPSSPGSGEVQQDRKDRPAEIGH